MSAIISIYLFVAISFLVLKAFVKNMPQFITFIFAAPYDLEVRLQKSSEQISNSQFYRRCQIYQMQGMAKVDIKKFLAQIEQEFHVKFDAAVIDPPRAGMERKALDALVKRSPKKIVYISCDPATLARDAKRLAEGNYRLLDVQPVDMFPQTYHIEAVATFQIS